MVLWWWSTGYDTRRTAEQKYLVFLLYAMTFVLSLPSVQCRPINILPWLTSRGAGVWDPPSSSPPAAREDDSENMAILLAAVDNLTDTIQKIGVREEGELNNIKAVILIQVLDLMRQYFSTVVPETSGTTKPCVTTASPPCITAGTPPGYRHRRRRSLSNDLPSFGAEVQPSLDDLILGFQDEITIKMEF